VVDDLASITVNVAAACDAILTQEMRVLSVVDDVSLPTVTTVASLHEAPPAAHVR